MRKWLLCICLCIWVLPTNAQWYKHLHKKQIAGTSRPPQAASLVAAVRRAALQTNDPGSLISAFSKSILKIKETDLLFRWNSLEGNAFVLEETYQGKKYLWGVTATHYLFQKPALKLPNYQTPRIYFEVQGSAGMNNISLFPLPPQMQGTVVPLHLAETPVQEGDELFSVGYWKGDLHIDMHRTVQEITPTRLITTLELDPEARREGTCGSPVLNQSGQVVGVHAGNSPLRQIGFVIPIQHIRQALQAYHQQNVFAQELIFKGISLGSIQINQFISDIELFSGSTKIGSFDMFQRVSQADYAHLENIVNTSGADRIVVWIIQNPLSMKDQDQHYYEWSISYDLNTGAITCTEPQKRMLP